VIVNSPPVWLTVTFLPAADKALTLLMRAWISATRLSAV
jgi:hypothetical protein